MTREEWLYQAAQLLEKRILTHEEVFLPENFSVSVGFPYGSSRAIGQAWSKEASADEKTHQIFISPILGKNDIVNLMQVLLHECIHICVGVDQKHGGEFKRVARSVGLEGRLTATYVSEGTELFNKLKEIADSLGEYPHENIKLKIKPKSQRQSKFTKLVSETNPDYKVKILTSLLEQYGYPQDMDGEEMIVDDSE